MGTLRLIMTGETVLFCLALTFFNQGVNGNPKHYLLETKSKDHQENGLHDNPDEKHAEDYWRFNNPFAIRRGSPKSKNKSIRSPPWSASRRSSPLPFGGFSFAGWFPGSANRWSASRGSSFWPPMSRWSALHLRPSSLIKYKECKTAGGEHCLFPFKYQGITYLECAQNTGFPPWCSTKTDRYYNHIKGINAYGDCSPGCPGMEESGNKTREEKTETGKSSAGAKKKPLAMNAPDKKTSEEKTKTGESSTEAKREPLALNSPDNKTLEENPDMGESATGAKKKPLATNERGNKTLEEKTGMEKPSTGAKKKPLATIKLDNKTLGDKTDHNQKTR